MKRIITGAICSLILSSPVWAQGKVDFGSDTSMFANDGECDDPRFEGAGMTATPLLDDDIMADATDCRNAFNAGTITMKPDPGTDELAVYEMIDGIIFGDDTSEWAKDGECDDRRFFGRGMASVLDWSNVGMDRTDCLDAYVDGNLELWNAERSMRATSCDAIDFGDDEGEYPFDSQCDDPRFEGLSEAMSVVSDTIGHDATDCQRACVFGTVSLRNY